MVRVRCARAIPSAEGWISGWDGGVGGCHAPFFQSPFRADTTGDQACARRAEGQDPQPLWPVGPIRQSAPFHWKPLTCSSLDPKNFSVADVINRQTLGRKAQVALPLNYFRQK